MTTTLLVELRGSGLPCWENYSERDCERLRVAFMKLILEQRMSLEEAVELAQSNPGELIDCAGLSGSEDAYEKWCIAQFESAAARPRSPEIHWDDSWPDTAKVRDAVERLTLLGFQVGSHPRSRVVNYQITIPWDKYKELKPPDWVEVGYLLAQLGDAVYPEDFYGDYAGPESAVDFRRGGFYRFDVDPARATWKLSLKKAKDEGSSSLA